MFSCGLSATVDLCADPFPFIITCSFGAGDGVDGLEIAAACMRVLTLEADMIALLSSWF